MKPSNQQRLKSLEESTDNSFGDMAFMHLADGVITDAHSGKKYTPEEYQKLVVDHPECVFSLLGNGSRTYEDEIEFTIEDLEASTAERAAAEAEGIEYNPEESPNPRLRAMAKASKQQDPALRPELEEWYTRMGRLDLVEYYRKESLRYKSQKDGSCWRHLEAAKE